MRSIERRVQQLETKRTEDGDRVTAIIRQIVTPGEEWAPTWAACGWGNEERLLRNPGEPVDVYENRVVTTFSRDNKGTSRIRMG